MKKSKQLIQSLIKDDLINTKLVNGLEDLGLNAYPFCTHLSDTIFTLIGITEKQNQETIHHQYSEMVKRVKYINISEGHQQLDFLATEIFTYLEHEKLKG
jgi:hypothetical protein